MGRPYMPPPLRGVLSYGPKLAFEATEAPLLWSGYPDGNSLPGNPSSFTPPPRLEAVGERFQTAPAHRGQIRGDSLASSLYYPLAGFLPLTPVPTAAGHRRRPQLSSAPTCESPAMAADLDDRDEVVDLGEAGDLDNATKIFFSDGDSIGATLSWPAAEGMASTLTNQASLRALCDKHGVSMEFRPFCANQYGWAACTTPPVGSNTICVYAAALDAGLRFPLHDFYARLLRHFRLAPSQLTPNAWSYMAAFVLRCKEAGVEPLVSAVHFHPYTEAGRRLFTGALPRKSGWKSRFFFLEGPSVMQWKCPVKWGKPRMDATRKVELMETAVKKLTDMGTVDDVRCFLARRQLPVGDQAPLHVAAVKAEAGGSSAAATAAESASTSNNRKSPPAAMSSCPPTSETSGLASFRAFSSAGGSGDPITPQQQRLFAMSTPTPQGLGHFRAFNASGSDESVPPQQQSFTMSTPARQGPGFPIMMFTSDALQLWEAIAELQAISAKANEHAAKAAKLSEELRLVTSWNAQYRNQLATAQAMHATERAQLISQLRAASGEIAQLKAGHVDGIAQLKEEHAAEIAQLKQELLAENAQLREELLAEATQLKNESYDMGWRDRDNQLKTDLLQDYNDMGCSPLVTAEDH
ncbi:hypothetical protein HU200_063989 [Digitaria exilis]|uniref:Transposase (putative) gypsy type domain-containing protein n=1 Tax=Digitaria exilis TaxID=1010633 RepID=A0A835AAE1_9POAL|nr:hypothetical protein HU200_063989 [Digitaria exilis]